MGPLDVERIWVQRKYTQIQIKDINDKIKRKHDRISGITIRKMAPKQLKRT